MYMDIGLSSYCPILPIIGNTIGAPSSMKPTCTTTVNFLNNQNSTHTAIHNALDCIKCVVLYYQQKPLLTDHSPCVDSPYSLSSLDILVLEPSCRLSLSFLPSLVITDHCPREWIRLIYTCTNHIELNFGHFGKAYAVGPHTRTIKLYKEIHNGEYRRNVVSHIEHEVIE
jgi:hypothetical protein